MDDSISWGLYTFKVAESLPRLQQSLIKEISLANMHGHPFRESSMQSRIRYNYQYTNLASIYPEKYRDIQLVLQYDNQHVQKRLQELAVSYKMGTYKYYGPMEHTEIKKGIMKIQMQTNQLGYKDTLRATEKEMQKQFDMLSIQLKHERNIGQYSYLTFSIEGSIDSLLKAYEYIERKQILTPVRDQTLKAR